MHSFRTSRIISTRKISVAVRDTVSQCRRRRRQQLQSDMLMHTSNLALRRTIHHSTVTVQCTQQPFQMIQSTLASRTQPMPHYRIWSSSLSTVTSSQRPRSSTATQERLAAIQKMENEILELLDANRASDALKKFRRLLAAKRKQHGRVSEEVLQCLKHEVGVASLADDKPRMKKLYVEVQQLQRALSQVQRAKTTTPSAPKAVAAKQTASEDDVLKSIVAQSLDEIFDSAPSLERDEKGRIEYFETLAATYRDAAYDSVSTQAKAKLAAILAELGDLYVSVLDNLDKAIAAYRETITIIELENGRIDTDIAELLLRIGRAFMTYEQLDEANEALTEALAIHRTESGEKHPNTAEVLHEFGKLYAARKDYEQASSNIDEALDIIRSTLGADHVDQVPVLRTQASVCIATHTPERAVEALEQAVRLARPDAKALEESEHDNSELILIRHELARAYMVSQKFDKALPILKQVRLEVSEMLGDEHPFLIGILSDISDCLSVDGESDEALSLSKRVCELVTKASGPMHMDTAIALTNVGSTLSRSEKLDEAMEFYERALKIVKQHKTVESRPHRAKLYALIASAMLQQGHAAEAVQYAELAYRMQKKILGEAHPETTNSLIGMCMAYEADGKYKEAAEGYAVAHRSLTKLLGPKHPDTERAGRAVKRALMFHDKPPHEHPEFQKLKGIPIVPDSVQRKIHQAQEIEEMQTDEEDH
jgi:tetratricopeptide (TPR) repeat protein